LTDKANAPSFVFNVNSAIKNLKILAKKLYKGVPLVVFQIFGYAKRGNFFGNPPFFCPKARFLIFLLPTKYRIFAQI